MPIYGGVGEEWAILGQLKTQSSPNLKAKNTSPTVNANPPYPQTIAYVYA